MERARRRALVAACLGNLVEWYEFALYGTFAVVIGATLFPASDGGGLVASLAVFGVAFVARPIGAVAFAHVGDRRGRRTVLVTSVLLMAIATAGIGLIPPFTAVGWLAPVLLLLLRLAQGVSVGGEYTASAAVVVEFADPDHRGLFGGLQWASLGFGLTLGFGVAAVLGAVLSPESLRAWGWRLPFVAALPLGVVAVLLRLRLEETPAFRTLRASGGVVRLPVVETLRTNRRSVAVGFGLVAAVTSVFNVFYVFLPNHLVAVGRADVQTAFGTAAVGPLLAAFVAPAFGRLSDHVGRRPVLLGGMGALALAIVPGIRLVASGGRLAMLASYGLVGLALGALALTAVLAELFPVHLRASGLSLTYGIASAVFGGAAPVAAAVMVRATGDLVSTTVWTAALALVGLVCAAFTRETAPRAMSRSRSAPVLDGSGP